MKRTWDLRLGTWFESTAQSDPTCVGLELDDVLAQWVRSGSLKLSQLGSNQFVSFSTRSNDGSDADVLLAVLYRTNRHIGRKPRRTLWRRNGAKDDGRRASKSEREKKSVPIARNIRYRRLLSPGIGTLKHRFRYPSSFFILKLAVFVFVPDSTESFFESPNL